MKHKATKRILSLLLAMVMLIGLLPTAAIPVFAVEESDIYAEDPNYEHGYFLGGAGAYEGGTWVREVYDWSDLVLVFQDLNGTAMTRYGYVTVKLMNDLSMNHVSEASVPISMVVCAVSGCSLSNIVFDFNGHTLNGTRSSTTDYSGGAFIELRLISGNCFTFIDSVGGGGINFSSEADHDNDVAALYINTSGERGEGYNRDDPDSYPAKVTFNGGSYKLNNSIERYSRGTLLCRSITYRGTVIANYVDVEINDGTFIAESECKDSDDDTQDLSARELSAFGTVLTNPSGLPEETNPEYGVVIPFEETGRTVINGGRFISDGYAVHHFDNCYEYLSNDVTDLWANNTGDLYHNEAYVLLDSHYHMNYPTINGGYFEGQLGFTGLTYTNSSGNSDLNIRPTYQIIPETSRYFGFDKDGNITFDTLIWKKLHDLQKCIVISKEALGLEVTPEGDGNPVKLIRNAKQSDTFEMSWTVPSYLEGEVVCQPTITITRPNSNIEPKTYTKSKLTLDYSYYPNDVNISCRLHVLAGGVGGESVYFKQNYEVDVNRIYTATDGCIHCYAAGEDGWDEIVEGETCAFVILPNDYYELTNPDALEVYVNGELVTPSGNGGYYVDNVTEDLDIYCDGSAFTSYSNLTVTANGKTVKEKILGGGTYTFKTLAEFGATVPEGSTFTGWKIGNKTYQPGETYTVPGGTEIAVNAVFTGLHNITVENGKAYADEAHTIPISAAAEDQVIYIVAAPAPEGKVFSYWSHQTATAGGGGSFGNYDAAQTTYKVYYSDVVLTPVYETQIDNIVINGMTKPSAGVAIDNSDYSYKWGCSVPADAGYTLGISYWYDITDGEPEFAMSDGDMFQIGHTYRFKARIHLKADHIYPANPEDIAVVLSGIDAEDYQCTINEVGYTSATIYFEFTCEREEPDTALICPKGDGTSGNPFQITNIGELYWFAAFVNGTASYPDGVTVERSEACAIVMNDITVNPGVLTEDGELNGTSGFAQWTPIGYNSNYSGTFDGQEHTISGIYYAPQAAADYRYGGFFRSLFKGGCIRDLTLADSYFRAPAKNSAYTGAFVGYIGSYCTVENCHFDGTVTTAITADSSDADKETYQYVYIAGIAGNVTYGEIRDCTARGLISGYGNEIGGIAAYVSNSEVTGCVNEATVETPKWGDIGGIVGRMVYSGIIRDCCNKGNVSGWSSAGIVSNVESTGGEVIRCWNEGKIEGPYGSGIVLSLMGSVKNCYNTGSVDEAGIVGTAYSGSSVTYCHNVGEITGYLGEPICSISSGSNITIENCYYLADSETDSVDGTTYKTADQFANQDIQMVTKMLNSGENAGNWKQGDGYPVLAQVYTLTINGGTGSGTYGVGTEVTVTAEVPDGYVFAGWDGIDGLIVEAGQPAEDSVSTTFLMPKRDVTLTAKFESIAPTRPAGDGTSGNPFEISTVGELYWFAGFVNGTIEKPADITVSIEKACAKVMNDITVNRNLLTKDYALNVSGEDTDLLAVWTPIAPANGYMGTFDGQGYAISGIYYNPGIDTAFYSTYYAGFFGCYINDGGIVRNLTLKDTYIGAPREKSTYDAGGIAGMVSSDGTVENCHFDGTVTADDTNGTYTIGGIAGRNQGVIRNCTTKGLVKGYTKGDIGGITGKVARYTEDGGYVIGCVNEATVKNTRSDDVLIYTGGIAGELYNGNIRDCCNKGNVSAVNDPAGIVSYVYGDSSVIRCWNEGDVEGEDSAGIVSQLRATVKNCYNTGSVNGAGIVARPYSYCSITYCHNVGDADSIVSFIDSYATIENCYYLADSETDVLDGTTAKTAAQFADGTVLALLNNGPWTQGEDDEYPVLGDAPGVTVSGMVTSFGEESEKTTVQLFPSGSGTPAFSITLTGTHAMYSFEGVEAGTYTMKVSKANHVTREYTVVVGNSPIPLDAKIHLKGDINGDGRINVSDVGLANAHAKKVSTLEGYQFDCANVNGDTRITISDVGLLNAHAKKTSLLW